MNEEKKLRIRDDEKLSKAAGGAENPGWEAPGIVGPREVPLTQSVTACRKCGEHE